MLLVANGSHTFNSINFGDNSWLTCGNTTNIDGDRATESVGNRHRFENIDIGKQSTVQFGNTGGNSEGHDFRDIKVGAFSRSWGGDFNSVAIKTEQMGLPRREEIGEREDSNQEAQSTGV